MKILMLCKKFPYPMKDGESIAVSNLAKELKALGCDISLLSMNTSKHYADTGNLPSEYNYFSAIHTVDLDNTIRPWQAFTSMVSGDSYHIRRFTSSLFQAKLIEILQKEQFDIVQLETLYMAPYVPTIRKYSQARIVMRAHNVEHEIWERITRNTGSHLRKLYLGYLTRKLRQYEIDQFESYDYLVTLTDRDLQLFRAKGYANGASSAPIGFDLSGYRYAPPELNERMSIGFIGSLDWMPNREGLEWFLSQCWPQIHQLWPDMTLHIAGRNTPADLLALRLPGVRVHGEVDDASAFIGRHAMMIVPLFSGSGMRVKVVEGMAMGKIVMTTTLGMEGIAGRHGEHLMIANTAEEFIASIAWCLANPDEALRVGMQGKALAAALFDSREAAREMLRIYRDLVSRPAHAASSPVRSLT